MTPYQFACAECANMLPDGRCLGLEALESRPDYRMALPGWLDDHTWQHGVARARERGELFVQVFHTRGEIDTGLVCHIDADGRKLNVEGVGRRYETMHFCPGCGTRLGCAEETCLVCRGVHLRDGPDDTRCVLARKAATSIVRELPAFRSWRGLDELRPTTTDAMTCSSPRRRCRYFEKCILPLADKDSPKDDHSLQARRLLAREAYYQQFPEARPPDGPASRRPRDARRCPDCGAPVAKRRRVCSECRRKRRRATYRRNRAPDPIGLRNS